MVEVFLYIPVQYRQIQKEVVIVRHTAPLLSTVNIIPKKWHSFLFRV